MSTINTAMTARNGGFYKAQHKQKLQQFLEAALLNYKAPVILHYRVNPHADNINALTAYLMNRLNRRGIKFSYVRANENNDLGTYLHSHWLICIEREHPEAVAELEIAMQKAVQAGVIKTYKLNPKKIQTELGKEWIIADFPYLALTEETIEEAYNWCAYALKKRSKEWALNNKKNPVTWSFPKPKAGVTSSLRSSNPRVYFGYSYSSYSSSSTANSSSRFNGRVVYA